MYLFVETLQKIYKICHHCLSFNVWRFIASSALLTEFCYFAPTSKSTQPAKEVVCLGLATDW